MHNNEEYSPVSAFITGYVLHHPEHGKEHLTLETLFKGKDGKELGRVKKSESVRA